MMSFNIFFVILNTLIYDLNKHTRIDLFLFDKLVPQFNSGSDVNPHSTKSIPSAGQQQATAQESHVSPAAHTF